ncbi:uncharacterized protein [Lolium perenne]|uniref:uncharacterized protein n=1 Tax=Lolium perenne TaxID=4522 RepID=UPI0021F55221|nr:glutathione S-transferase T3-like [Lolium perenne]
MVRQSTRIPAPPPSPSPLGTQQVSSAENASALFRSTPVFWPGEMTRSRASSSQPPPADKHAWNIPAAGFSTPIPNWGVDPRPPGGFVNYLHDPSSVLPQQPVNQHTMAQNFHFVGGPLPSAPFSAPQPSVFRGIPSPSLANERTPLQTSQSQRATNLDSGDEDGDVRTEKRLAWTKDEDERLMSAWLYNSNDPISGNNKKSDQYWGDVARVYNSTTPRSRKRSVKQAKDHWHSLNKLVYQFHCCYSKASAIYASGQSDAQLLEKAFKFYEDDYKSQFHHYDCWKAVNEWPKWRTYNEWLENTKKRKTSDAGVAGEDTSSPKDAEDIPRPIGTKAAKAERNGKGKSKEVAADMELLEKLVAAQAEGKKASSEKIEMRKRVSSEKLETARLSAETARLSAQAAKDNMEARKLDKEAEMMRAYRELLVQDTIGMTDEMRNEHVKTLKVMRERLFGV